MLFFSNVHAVIDHCFCFGNIATEGASLYLGGYHTGFEMRNSSVENGISAYGAGVYIASSNEHVIITGSTIFNNEASEMGGGLYSIGSGLTIASCFLIGNRGGFDHGLYGGVLLSETVSATIVDTIFMNNTGGAGGALGIISSSNVMVSGCKFYYNTASALSGAAIWLSAVSDASITGNILGGNRAPRGGGSIFWLNSTMDEPPGVLSSNDFLSSNSALYGSSVATEAVSLLMDSNNSYNVTNYDTSVAAATVYAMDYYSQIVRDASEMAVVASVLSSTQCFEGSGYVAGGFIDIFSAGVATFGTLEAYCAPGYTMEVFLSSTIAGVSLQTSFVLWFRDCVRGEYFGDNICSECDSGTYSITDPSSVLSLSELRQTEVCLECVDGASTCYGDTVVLKDGFWRVSEYSTIAVRCPYDGSCAGGGGTGNELCADGYKGMRSEIFKNKIKH